MTKKFTGICRLLESETIQTVLNKLSDGTYREFIHDWKWIFSYSRKYRGAIIVHTILGVLSSTFGLGSAVVSKYLIDIIINRKTSQLWLLIFAMLFSSLFSILFSAAVSRLSTKISIFVHNDIRADIYGKIMDAEWLRLNEYENGDLLNRFSNDIRSVASNAVNWLPDLIIQIYTFIATFAVICYYDVFMALIACLSAPFLLLSGRYILKKLREHKKAVLEVNSAMMGFEVETFYNYDTIKSFGIAGLYQKKLEQWQQKFADTNLEYNSFTIRSNAWLSALTSFVSLAAFGYCLYRLWGGAITFGTMSLFLQQRSKLSSNFDSLVKVIPNMVNSAVAAHRVKEIAELPKEQHHLEKASEFTAAAHGGVTIQLKNVDFAYVEEKPVLTNSDFIARPNEIIALVGPSGEGKTTIIRMILGLIQPQSGEAVLIDRDGQKIGMNADLRGLFSYVPQGNTLMSGTIAENLRMAKENASEEEMTEALKIACAWEFVQNIPQGIYGKLGNRGKGVSEGQAQRIAIARAVLRDAPILLLDEATSALDVETERKVLKNIMKQCPNKTCIVSTHRPSVLNMCQRVYRVMDTKVTELDEETSARMVQDF